MSTLLNYFLAPWRRFSRNVVVLGFVSLLNDISSESVARILPLFLRETTKASFVAIGWVEGVADSLSVILKLASGWLADTGRGKKVFLAAGYGLSALTRPFFPVVLATFGWTGALGLKALDRVGKALRTAPRDALIALESESTGQGAAFGLNRSLDTIGALIGILMAAFVLWQNGDVLSPAVFRLVIGTASLFGFAAVALILWGVQEKRTLSPAGLATQNRPVGSYRDLPRSFFVYLICVGIFTLAGSSDAFLLLKLRSAGFSLGATLALIAAYNALAALTAYPVAKLSDRLMNRKAPILIGWIIYAFAYGLFGLSDNLLFLGMGFAGYGLYYGFVESTEKALVAEFVPQTHLGRAYGLFSFVTGLLLLPANLLFGFLSDQFGMATAFQASSFIVLIATSLLAFIKVPTKTKHSAVV